MRPEERERADKLAIQELFREAASTADQVETLLKEIRDYRIENATLKNELSHVSQEVNNLSKILNSNENAGSVLIRLALLESSLESIKQYMSQDNQEGGQIKTRVSLLEQQIHNISSELDKLTQGNLVKKEGKWKVFVALIGGGLAIIGSVIAALIKYL